MTAPARRGPAWPEGSVEARWRREAGAYRALVGSGAAGSSAWLREEGLKPTVVRLVGDCADATLLDAGTGGGWLFDRVRPRVAYARDFVEPPGLPDWVGFSDGDFADLRDWPEASVDVVVSSLALCYCQDLGPVLREFARVVAPGGRLVVALVHPDFYGTGTANEAGDFTLTADLGTEETMAVAIGGSVGPFPYYRRGMPAYVNGMIDAGFDVVRAEDWWFDRRRYVEAGASTDGTVRSHKVPVFAFLVGRRRAVGARAVAGPGA